MRPSPWRIPASSRRIAGTAAPSSPWTQRTEEGIYRYQADFSDLTLRQTFTAE